MSISTKIINTNKREMGIKGKADSSEAKVKDQHTGTIDKYLRLISNNLELCLMVNYK